MSDRTIYVATSSVLSDFDGRPLYIHRGVTTVRAGHPLLDTFGALFEPLIPMFEVKVEQGDEGNPESAETAPKAPPPAAKDVRAWAAEQGIEVPARGQLPAEVVEQYQAAQQGA